MLWRIKPSASRRSVQRFIHSNITVGHSCSCLAIFSQCWLIINLSLIKSKFQWHSIHKMLCKIASIFRGLKVLIINQHWIKQFIVWCFKAAAQQTEVLHSFWKSMCPWNKWFWRKKMEIVTCKLAASITCDFTLEEIISIFNVKATLQCTFSFDEAYIDGLVQGKRNSSVLAMEWRFYTLTRRYTLNRPHSLCLTTFRCEPTICPRIIPVYSTNNNIYDCNNSVNGVTLKTLGKCIALICIWNAFSWMEMY